MISSLALIAVVVVRPWRGPLLGSGDLSVWEYAGYSLQQYIRWGLVPRLDLYSNDTLYPWGVAQVFQPWSLERDALLAVFDNLFGTGPWLRLYFLGSVAGTMAGVYLLLCRAVGVQAALWAACAATLLNFYAFSRYPGHLSLAVLHWAVLGVVADFRILLGARQGHFPDLRLLLFRVFCFVSTLGLELAYVANMAFVATALFSATSLVMLIVRRRSARIWLSTWVRQGRRHTASCSLLLILCAMAIWFYLPLVIEIARASGGFTSEFDYKAVVANRQQILGDVSPLRLLLPCFPGLNPVEHFIEFHDQPVDRGSGSVGWALLLPAIWGAWRLRRRPILLMPILLILALFLSYQMRVPLLRNLPTAHFMRVVDRVGLLVPVLLVLCGLSVPWRRLPRWAIVGYVVLAIVESATAYHLYRPGDGDWRITPQFERLMATVRASSGEAVMEWPFCIAGGNGVATPYLGRFYGRNSHLFGLRRFHGKKVVGQYMGRFMPSQTLPFLRSGWPAMFMPDDPNYFRARRQSAGFDSVQWRFFERFLRDNDFCGLLLCVELLAPGDAENFYRRLGVPIFAAQLPGVGRVEFIPRPSHWPRPSDAQAGRNVVLEDPAYHARMGMAVLRDGHPHEAVPSFLNAVCLEPRNPVHQNNLGVAYGRVGRLQEAEAAFRRAVAMAPEYGPARRNLDAIGQR